VPPPSALESALDDRILAFLETHAVPGLAVGVVKDGRTVYARGFGIADPETGRPVTARSLFHVASVSKTFTAAAVVQLAEDDRIDLDAPIRAYLPSFRLADDGFLVITVRQLLTHTSGMPDVLDYGWETPEDDDAALERYVRSLVGTRMIADPGARWSYSSMGYDVLGQLVASLSGRSFETHMRERILDPVGMQRSTFLRAEVEPGLGTTPHVGRWAPEVSPVYPFTRAHAPSSTLHSNAEEMCRWIIACAGRGTIEGRRILSSDAFGEMWTPHSAVRPGREQGMGWMLGASPLGLWALHGGRDVGFRSHLTVLPDQGGGLVILSNWSDTPVRILRDAIMAIAFTADAASAPPAHG
jgi:CubicO group peptidase (beta-lactamase class C family)